MCRKKDALRKTQHITPVLMIETTEVAQITGNCVETNIGFSGLLRAGDQISHHLQCPGCAACALSASAADLSEMITAADRNAGAGNEMARLLTGGGKSVPEPGRKLDIKNGPYKRMVIRGATVIDGTGAPPIGPMDIVIEHDRITEVRTVGHPGLPINPKARPEAA